MSEPPKPPRGPGRPRKDAPLSPVTAWVPPAVHDRLLRLAKQHDQSVSGVLRTVLVLKLAP
jgi:hypothetical protein